MICAKNKVLEALLAVGLFMSCSVQAMKYSFHQVGLMKSGKLLKYEGKYFKISQIGKADDDQGTITLKPSFYEDRRHAFTDVPGIKHKWVDGNLKLTFERSAFSHRVFECRIKSDFKTENAKMSERRARRNRVKERVAKKITEKIRRDNEVRKSFHEEMQRRIELKQRAAELEKMKGKRIKITSGHSCSGRIGMVTGLHNEKKNGKFSYMVEFDDGKKPRSTRVGKDYFEVWTLDYAMKHEKEIWVKMTNHLGVKMIELKESGKEDENAFATGDIVSMQTKPIIIKTQGKQDRYRYRITYPYNGYLEFEDRMAIEKNIKLA